MDQLRIEDTDASHRTLEDALGGAFSGTVD